MQGRVERNKLTDGSYVFNVVIHRADDEHDLIIYCDDEHGAHRVLGALTDCAVDYCICKR